MLLQTLHKINFMFYETLDFGFMQVVLELSIKKNIYFQRRFERK